MLFNDLLLMAWYALTCPQTRSYPLKALVSCEQMNPRLLALQLSLDNVQASFHGLVSASTANAELDIKSVTIRRPKDAPALTSPEVTCADILFALAEQPAGLTPALLAEYTAQHSHERSSEASYVFA